MNTCLRPRTWWGRWWGLPLAGWSPGPEEGVHNKENEDQNGQFVSTNYQLSEQQLLWWWSWSWLSSLAASAALLCCLYAWLQFGNKTQLENENRPGPKIKILWLPSSFPGSKFLHMSALLKNGFNFESWPKICASIWKDLVLFWIHFGIRENNRNWIVCNRKKCCLCCWSNISILLFIIYMFLDQCLMARIKNRKIKCSNESQLNIGIELHQPL